MSQKREFYLYKLSQDMNVPLFIVMSMAEVLGDHDGLEAVLEAYQPPVGDSYDHIH